MSSFQLSPSDMAKFDQDVMAYKDIAKDFILTADRKYHEYGGSDIEAFAQTVRTVSAWFTATEETTGREIPFEEKWQKIAFLFAATVNIAIELQHDLMETIDYYDGAIDQEELFAEDEE